MGVDRFVDSEHNRELFRVSEELNTYETSLGTYGGQAMMMIDMVTHLERKRFFLDAEPVEQYASNTVLPPQYIRDIIQLPYPSMYMEFSRGVEIGEQEPNREHDGTFYSDTVKAIFLDSDESTLMSASEDLPPLTVVAFMDDPTGLRQPSAWGWRWRAFFMNLQTGKAYTPLDRIVKGHDPSLAPPDGVLEMMADTGAVIQNELGGTHDIENPFIEAGSFGMNRYIGWWERCIMATARTISWLTVFLTARGVNAYPSTVLPRAERKLLKKNPMLRTPQPFHIVNIGNPTYSSSGDGTKRHQTVRYDVRGHLRYGRHKLKNGDYRATIEWVQPHQRGLANGRYVPPTYNVSPDRKVEVDSM